MGLRFTLPVANGALSATSFYSYFSVDHWALCRFFDHLLLHARLKPRGKFFSLKTRPRLVANGCAKHYGYPRHLDWLNTLLATPTEATL